MNYPVADRVHSNDIAAGVFLDDAEVAVQAGLPTFEQFAVLQRAWSQMAFGFAGERGPVGPLKHLRKEVDEAIAAAECVAALEKDLAGAPEWMATDYTRTKLVAARARLLEEFADLLFLVFDPLWRAGFGLTDLRRALAAKLIKNRSRSWQKTSADQPVEHDRTGETSG